MKEWIEPLNGIIKNAGAILLDHFQPFGMIHTIKEDGSPVCRADHDANDYLMEALYQFNPSIPIISEEGDIDQIAPNTYWLIDPLDGTRQFVHGKPYFCVNIALIDNHNPIFGMIYVPQYRPNVVIAGFNDQSNHECYVSYNHKQFDSVPPRIPKNIKRGVVGSSEDYGDHVQSIMKRMNVKTVSFIPSAIKFCIIALGQADIYVRTKPTKEWDTAAGHAIINSVGAHLETLDGFPLLYGKHSWINPAFIVHDLPINSFLPNKSM
jgi:3'(2'), 5'-bisphosphate nucleotidase